MNYSYMNKKIESNFIKMPMILGTFFISYFRDGNIIFLIFNSETLKGIAGMLSLF